MGVGIEVEKIILESEKYRNKINEMISALGQNCLNNTKSETQAEVDKIENFISDFIFIPLGDLIYLRNGHLNRDSYLEYLAEEYLVDISTVIGLSNILGREEDFDGLIASLEDL